VGSPNSAPTGLVATGQARQIALTWNALAGALNYTVSRATNTGGPYTANVSGLTVTNYLDSPLPNGATYYYIVSAQLTYGPSLPSTEVSATTPSMPTITAQPTPVSATRIAGQPFRLTAAGGANTVPLTLYWQKNGVALPATMLTVGSSPANNTLNFAALQASDAGSYTLVVTNVAGAVTSTSSPLVVYPLTIGSYLAAVVSNTPTAFWQLDETNGTVAYDSFGAFDGTYNSGATLGVPGPRSPAFPGFAGDNRAVQTVNALPNSYVTVPPLNLNSSTVTISAWVQPNTGVQDTRGIFTTRGAGTDVGGLAYRGPATGQPDNVLGYNWNNDPNAFQYNSGLVIPSNQWSFVAVVIQPTQATLYLWTAANGLRSATNINPHANQPWAASAWIGWDSTNGPTVRTFDGSIDSAAVFNHALQWTDIQGLVSAATTSVASAPPVAAFSFGPTSVPAGGTVFFTNTTAQGTFSTALWSFGDGGTSGNTNLVVSYAYSTPGTYSVSLTVTNSSGLSGGYTNPTPVVVTVSLPPAPTIQPVYLDAAKNLVIRASTVTGHNYVLEKATALNAPITWTPVSTNAGTGGVITNAVPMSGNAKAFFRYRAQ
jgi:hypothetical protein